jgi:glycosyltransferase involved in cell wall biosynthesis
MKNTSKVEVGRDEKQFLSKQKTVLFFSNSLPNFMAHRGNLLRPLLERQIKVVLVTGGVTPQSSGQMPDGVNLIPLCLERHALAPRTDFSAIIELVKAIRLHRPDVIHSVTIKPNLFSALCLKLLKISRFKIPRLIMTFPGLGRVFEGDSSAERVRRWLVSRLLASSLKGLDYLATFENDSDKSVMMRRNIINPERGRVLMGAGIDLSLYFPPQHPRDGRLTFLCASRLLVLKGIPEYVTACNALAAEGVDADFWLAGPNDTGYPGNYDPAAADTEGSLGVVKYLGAVASEKMPSLLRECDVVCSPSLLREGFPRVLIEAAACGAALISSDQPSVYPIVRHCETGWLVNVHDSSALLNSMREAAKDPRHTRAMGQSALELFRSLPASDADVAQQFLSFYFD